MPKKKYIPNASFLELLEADLALRYARSFNSADFLATQIIEYGSKIGYKPVCYMLKAQLGQSTTTPHDMKPAEAQWFLENGPEWLCVHIKAETELWDTEPTPIEPDNKDWSKVKEWIDKITQL